ncbi:MAG: hypothetical protein AAFX80_04205 [Cyanobacteria bacterium J06639_18]
MFVAADKRYSYAVIDPDNPGDADLAELLWEYQQSVVDIPYNRIFSDELYIRSLKNYQEKVSILFGKIRDEISKPLRLAPYSTCSK